MLKYSITKSSTSTREEEVRMKSAQMGSATIDAVRYVWLQQWRGNWTPLSGFSYSALCFSTDGKGGKKAAIMNTGEGIQQGISLKQEIVIAKYLYGDSKENTNFTHKYLFHLICYTGYFYEVTRMTVLSNFVPSLGLFCCSYLKFFFLFKLFY
jgi:hypothetical protein